MIKDFSWILTPFLIAILLSCTPTPEVRFLEPQPINKRDLKSFPNIYQGKYRSKTDSSILIIASKMITEELIGVAKIAKNDMFEELDTIFLSDTEVTLADNLSLTVIIDGDSAIMRTNGGIDTLFILSDKTKLRSLKGYLFLNSQRTDSTWRVKALQLKDGNLGFDELISSNQIDSLKDITHIVTGFDSVANRIDHYNLNPEKRELKEILRIRETETGFIKL